jgi:hypothetical protein
MGNRIKLRTDHEKACLSRKYRFSIFEAESKELYDYSEAYKYGFGICFVSPAQIGLTIPLHETNTD